MVTSALLSLALLQAGTAPSTQPGQIAILDKEGQTAAIMPLQKTVVNAEAEGMAARVTLVQTFNNPSKSPIEAIYTFPMSEDAAVDRMRIRIGDRIIEGEIKPREEARRIYEAAKAAGQTASLLDQERPNIFTQSLANVMPGQKIEVEISYVEVLDYKDGQFEFSFPMTVGPRFIPGSVTDPDKISPPITPDGTRTGANIELNVAIASAAPLQTVESVLHAVKVNKGGQVTNVSLSRKDEIANRDFILRWRPAGDGVQTGFYATHNGKTDGTFSLVFMPPQKPANEMVRPKEVLFVMDQSGSQSGFPLEKSKELTKKLIQNLNPGDTFNVMSFSDQPRMLWTSAQGVNETGLAEALAYVDGLTANGGTVFAPAVRLAYSNPPQGGRLKMIVFNTDGFIGNEAEVLTEIKRRRDNARMFTFGIGNSTNRFLINAMSVEGRGDSEIVTLATGADDVVDRFIKRTRNPLLTDIKITAEGIGEITPEYAPDVFGAEPVVVFGRYSQPGRAKITISGRLGDQPWSKTLDVMLPAKGEDNSPLPVLWARKRVDDLTRAGLGQAGEDAENIKARITEVGLKYGIMTAHTSFVAVEKRVVNIGGKQRTVAVPVEMADGVSYAGVGLARCGGFAPASANAKSGGPGGGAGGAFSYSSKVTGETGAEMAQLKPEDKIASRLRTKKGNQEVMIRVKEITPELIESLKKLGMKIAEQDKTLKVVFGEVDASQLLEIAKLEQILAIDPVE